MPTNIKCPNCATVFDVENVLSADVEQKLRQQFEDSLAQVHAEKKKLEEAQREFEEKRKKENANANQISINDLCITSSPFFSLNVIT